MGALYHLLQNRIYRGEIVHKDKSYPGKHQAIVDEGLWDDVQRRCHLKSDCAEFGDNRQCRREGFHRLSLLVDRPNWGNFT